MAQVLKGLPEPSWAGYYIASHQASPGRIYLTNQSWEIVPLKTTQIQIEKKGEK